LRSYRFNRNGPDVPFHRERRPFSASSCLRSRPGTTSGRSDRASAVDGQHVPIGGYERGIGLRRKNPAHVRGGAGELFFSVLFRSLIAVHRSTILHFHDLFLQHREGLRARPLGAWKARAIILASVSRANSEQPPVRPLLAAQTQLGLPRHSFAPVTI